MRKRALFLLLATALLAACGPQIGINAGLKASPVDVAFGAQHQPTPSPVGPVPFENPFPNFPAALAPPLEGFVFPNLPVSDCPIASLGVPDRPAPSIATKVPAAATYPFHYGARAIYNPGTTSEKVVDLPKTGTRQVVAGALNTDGSYSFEVVEAFNGTITTYAFSVIPSSTAPAPPAPPQVGPVTPGPEAAPTGNPGIYLTHMDVKSADPKSNTGTDSFTPTPAVLLMPMPAGAGEQFTGAGTDGSTATTMEIDPGGGVLVGDDRVDACGTTLDSWKVEVKGRIVNATQGPSGVTTFDLTFWDATQYGGIPIAYHLMQSQTDQKSGQPVNYDIAGTISVKPQDPKS